MIKKLKIQGFKSIVDFEFQLTNLTVLAGLNNSGKSTVVQSLRMCAASYNGLSPLLSGYGDVNELRSSFVNNQDDIVFKLTFETGLEESLVISNKGIKQSPKKFPEFFYIGADRFGPQPFLPLNIDINSKFKVGDRGEFIFDFIQKLSNYGYTVPEIFFHEASEGKSFEYTLQGWLSEISPGVKLSFNSNKNADISHANINRYRPSNTGFGLSYALPIIATILGVASIAPKNHEDEWLDTWEQLKLSNGLLVILENPEAHLHPRGQTAMGRLIALAASIGIQCLVETHSEHVMDGIRIGVKEGLINHDLVKFYYLTKEQSEETKVLTPDLNSEGKIDSWPQGFFDQTLINRSILAKRKS